jgi:hypothetical protein
MTPMPFFPGSRKSGRGRRREDDGLRAVTFEIDNLEFVQASDDIGLLRVGGRWVAPASQALDDIHLRVRRDTELLEIGPLPDMNGASPVASPSGEDWRGAFTMTVELAGDPRTELALVAGEDADVALPRPAEWEAAQRALEAARQDEVDEDEPDDFYYEDDEREPEPEPELEPLELETISFGPPPVPEPDVEPEAVQPIRDPKLTELRAELELSRMQLEETQAELESERRRRLALEHELGSKASVEEDLRNAMAMQEAELSSAVAQASQRVRQAERRRDLGSPPSGDQVLQSRARPLDDELLARLERARRASEAAAP